MLLLASFQSFCVKLINELFSNLAEAATTTNVIHVYTARTSNLIRPTFVFLVSVLFDLLVLPNVTVMVKQTASYIVTFPI